MIDKIETEITVLNNKITELKKELQEKVSPLIEGLVKGFLDKYDDVEYVFWTQYTPYFNDGETCEFGVNEICFAFEGGEDEDDFAYEGNTIWTQDDVDCYEEYLADAVAYVESPDAWVEGYYIKNEWARERFNSGFYRNSKPKPYYTVQEATEGLEMRKAFLEKYDTKTFQEDFDKVKASINSIDDEYLKEIFGDHARVAIYRTGVEIEEYDHD